MIEHFGDSASQTFGDTEKAGGQGMGLHPLQRGGVKFYLESLTVYPS